MYSAGTSSDKRRRGALKLEAGLGQTAKRILGVNAAFGASSLLAACLLVLPALSSAADARSSMTFSAPAPAQAEVPAAVSAAPSLAPAPGPSLAPAAVAPAQFPLPASPLLLKSNAALVLDQSSGQTLYGKNVNAVLPIASITKLMTAMVVLDANLDPNELLTVSNEDVDVLRGSSSRLRVGAVATREDMLRLALIASENRAAAALSRYYPGGRPAFVAAMNRKARSLGMTGTHYDDSTGLTSNNVSTAEDLAILVRTAHQYDKIREFTTTANDVATVNGRTMAFHNTNRLVASPGWDIGLSKTGYISEAGKCLVMQATLAGRAVVIVLLDSLGSYTRLADAGRIRHWLEVAAGYANPISVAHAEPRPTRATRAAARASTRKTASHSRTRRHHITVAARAHNPA